MSYHNRNSTLKPVSCESGIWYSLVTSKMQEKTILATFEQKYGTFIFS